MKESPGPNWVLIALAGACGIGALVANRLSDKVKGGSDRVSFNVGYFGLAVALLLGFFLFSFLAWWSQRRAKKGGE